MADSNPRSTAAIFGHPLHPMLVGFPIAFFTTTFVCDLVVWATGPAGWAEATVWLLGAGLVTAIVAAALGLTDLLGDRRINALDDARLHAVGNGVVVLLELFNLGTRFFDGPSAIVPTGLIVSSLVMAILAFTGWKGWGMVYKHRVGVRNEGEQH